MIAAFLAIATSMGPPPRVVMATTFLAHDRFNPNPRLACFLEPVQCQPNRQRIGTKKHPGCNRHRRLLNDKTDMLVASRVLPCRTRLRLFNPRTGRSTVAVVGDRLGNHRRKDGTYYSELDLSPAVAKRLRFDGYEPIVIKQVKGH